MKKSAEIMNIDIPGVDTKTGFTLYGGEPGTYIEILRAFVADASGIAEKLRRVSRETLRDYAVSVHGLKGICAAIGAKELRQMAARLESLSKEGNLAEVLAENSAFLAAVEVLVSDIQNAVEKIDRANPKPLMPEPDGEVLARLRESCAVYDMTGIDEAMAELERFSYENDSSLIIWLRQKINEMDLEAAARLPEYKEKTGLSK